MRKPADLLSSGILNAIGVGALIEGIRLDLGKPTEPGPGFYPFIIGIILIVLASTLLIQALRGRTTGSEPFGELRGSAILIASISFCVLTLEPLGYVISMFFLAVIVQCVLQNKSWWRIALVGFVLSIGSYVLFDTLLGVLLPRGILEGIF
jgi:hypothetical protein